MNYQPRQIFPHPLQTLPATKPRRFPPGLFPSVRRTLRSLALSALLSAVMLTSGGFFKPERPAPPATTGANVTVIFKTAV
jgi:hypothetical protein